MAITTPGGFDPSPGPRLGTQIRVTPMVNYIFALVFILMLIAGVLIAAAIASA
jgi:regulator of protease activity HflC (stomatin/prohibitin superfamily)